MVSNDLREQLGRKEANDGPIPRAPQMQLKVS